MKSENEHIDDLLGKYLSGEASEPEAVEAEAWIRESEENQRHFDQLSRIFRSAAAIRDYRKYDTDAAWLKVRANLRKSNGKVVSMNASPGSWWWKAAAAVLLVLAAAVYLFRGDGGTTQEIQVVAVAKALSDTLPNGTGVFLNKETKVLYSYDRKKKRHEIKLEGEAYFDVNQAPGEDLIVQAGEVFIRDIGTAFNVNAYPGSDIVEVLVEEGEVAFYTAKNPGIRLKESGRAIYNRKTGEFRIEAPEPNITAYKTRFFVFSDVPLSEAISSLNEVYDTTLVIDDKIRNCPITVSFRDESIDEIAAIISETLALESRRQDGKIILTGNGCD